MNRFSSYPAWFVLPLAAVITLGCGGGRKLQSVSLSPASADAKSFTNGQVVFTATGMFTAPPSPVQLTSKDVVWCVGDSQTGGCPGFVNPGAIVDPNGVAQCNPLFTGTVTVLAGNVGSVSRNPDGGFQMKVFGWAKLTCP